MQCGAYLYLPIAVEKCRQHELWVYSCPSLWPQVLRTRRASQAILARVEECLPSLPTYTLDRHLARLKAFGDFEHKESLMTHRVSPTWRRRWHHLVAFGLRRGPLRFGAESFGAPRRCGLGASLLWSTADVGGRARRWKRSLGVWEGFHQRYQRRREELLMTCRS